MDSSRSLLLPQAIEITDELQRRPARTAAPEAELKAHRELATLMTIDPELAIQRFLDLALDLCPAAGSAGLSELSRNDAGEEIFLWTALSGAYAGYVGGTTPRDFSPCGLCLDHRSTILLDRPQRRFTYLADATPEIAEGLIVPLYDTGNRPIGTLWIIAHDAQKGFDATDTRILGQLAVQLVLAIKLRRKSKLMHDLEQAAREKELLLQEIQHRTKNTIQMISALLHLQGRGAKSREARTALRETQERLTVLASIHEALLHPAGEEAYGKVDVSALARSLAEALIESSSRRDQIAVRLDCEDLVLDAAQAVPLGLIVNEALTNAFKHAVPEGSSGAILIALKRSGAKVELSIRDDGIGISAPVREGSLGMRLIRNLARQAGGRLDVDGDGGTSIAVTLRVREKPAVARRMQTAGS